MKQLTRSEWYTEIYSWLIRIFIVLTFFFPMYYSSFKKHMYYIGLLWPYLFLLPIIGMIVFKHRKEKWQNKKMAIWLSCLTILYAGFSYYVNKQYHHWMWEEIHNTIAFLFLIVILIYPQWKKDLNFDPVRYLLGCITLSMFCAIVFYRLGYAGLLLHNDQIEMTRVSDMVKKYGETRLSWIYYHKSQFALMQIVFLGFAYTYRMKFKNRIYYIFAQGIFIVCLILSHSWTALAAAALLLCGVMIDRISCYLKEKKSKFSWKYIGIGSAIIFALVLLAGCLFLQISRERNLLTLGSRIPIWKIGLQVIKENPQGVGKAFGENLIDCGLFLTNNCHNVFLNAVFRFSIPVGSLFILYMCSYFIYAVYKKHSFFGLGYIIAILMMLCIDYSLLSYGVASFLLLVCLTMQPDNREGMQHIQGESKKKISGGA